MILDIGEMENALKYAKLAIIEENGTPIMIGCQFTHGPFKDVYFGLSNFFLDVDNDGEPKLSFELSIIKNEDELDTDSEEFRDSVKMLVNDILDWSLSD